MGRFHEKLKKALEVVLNFIVQYRLNLKHGTIFICQLDIERFSINLSLSRASETSPSQQTRYTLLNERCCWFMALTSVLVNLCQSPHTGQLEKNDLVALEHC